MTRLTDGKKTVSIEMRTFKDNNLTPDWSDDFFEVGGLQFDDQVNAYIVDDVDYCVEQAFDWKNMIGDYSESDDIIESEKNSGLERIVNIFEEA